MVGFEQTTYAIPEGAMSETCVIIVSPDDIGTTQVYLEVVTTENPDGVGSEASKIVPSNL